MSHYERLSWTTQTTQDIVDNESKEFKQRLITTMLSGLALASVFLLMLPTPCDFEGIVTPGGQYEIVPINTRGDLAEIRLNVGDPIVSGQIIGTIDFSSKDLAEIEAGLRASIDWNNEDTELLSSILKDDLDSLLVKIGTSSLLLNSVNKQIKKLLAEAEELIKVNRTLNDSAVGSQAVLRAKIKEIAGRIETLKVESSKPMVRQKIQDLREERERLKRSSSQQSESNELKIAELKRSISSELASLSDEMKKQIEQRRIRSKTSGILTLSPENSIVPKVGMKLNGSSIYAVASSAAQSILSVRINNLESSLDSVAFSSGETISLEYKTDSSAPYMAGLARVIQWSPDSRTLQMTFPSSGELSAESKRKLTNENSSNQAGLSEPQRKIQYKFGDKVMLRLRIDHRTPWELHPF